MARILKILTTLRNHWKKSTFAACLLTYGGSFAYDRYETSCLMQQYCKKALVYGDVPLKTGVKPRQITIILNPKAKNSSAKSLYEKFAAPLFHLAGIKVSLFVTEYRGQACDLMGIMDNADAVVIAGGSGTFHEAITGLLNRSDAAEATERFPLGVLPLGKACLLSKYLYWKDSLKEATFIAEAALSVIEAYTRRINALKVDYDIVSPQQIKSSEESQVTNDNISVDQQQQDQQLDQQQDQQQAIPVKAPIPVYGASCFEHGVWHEIEARSTKYWYWGSWKRYASHVFATLPWRSIENNRHVDVVYTPRCTGCSKCYGKQNELSSVKLPSESVSRWWSAFVPRSKSPKKIDYSRIVNPECGVEREIGTMQYAEFKLKCNHKNDLAVEVYPSEAVSRVGVARRAWENPQVGFQTSISDAGKISINFPKDVVKEKPVEKEGEKPKREDIIVDRHVLSIDAEPYRIFTQNWTVSLIPNAIRVFVPAPLRTA